MNPGDQIAIRSELAVGDRAYPTGAIGVVESIGGPSLCVRLAAADTAQTPRSNVLIVRDGELAGGDAAVFLRVVVGSRAYGLDSDHSDTDIRGVYAPSAAVHWSLDGAPEQFQSDETQTVLWEVEKCLRLALKANPSVLEMLWSPLVEFASPLGKELLSLRERFLSKAVYKSFLGYADAQFAAIERANAASTNAGKGSGGAGGKWRHAMHLIRLLIAGEGLVRTGRLELDAREHRDLLLSIKRGERAWSEVEGLRTAWRERFDREFASTVLQDEPDVSAADALLIKVRRTMAGESARSIQR